MTIVVDGKLKMRFGYLVCCHRNSLP